MLLMPRVNPRRNPAEVKWILTDEIDGRYGDTKRIYHLDIGDKDTHYFQDQPVPMIKIGGKMFVVEAMHQGGFGEDFYFGSIEEAQDGVPSQTSKGYSPLFHTDGYSLSDVKRQLIEQVRAMRGQPPV